MKYGLFTCGYQRYPLVRAFEDAVRFGYDYIELWGGYPHAYVDDLDDKRIAEIKELIAEYRMPVRCFTPEHNGYPFNYMQGSDAQWERSMAYLERAVEVTSAIGAEYMLFSAGHAGYQVTERQIRERLLRSVRRLVKKAEDEGVVLILEPLTIYESNVVTNLNTLEAVLEAVPSDHLMGMCDLAVPFTNGEPAAEYVRRLGKRYGYLHIIDNDGCSDSHMLPGTGSLPLAEVLQAFKAEGFDGLATIELVTGYLKEPSVYAKIAIDYMRKLEV